MYMLYIYTSLCNSREWIQWYDTVILAQYLMNGWTSCNSGLGEPCSTLHGEWWFSNRIRLMSQEERMCWGGLVSGGEAKKSVYLKHYTETVAKEPNPDA